jgi:hypothetical protein
MLLQSCTHYLDCGSNSEFSLCAGAKATPTLGRHSQCDAGWPDVHAEGLFGSEPTGAGARRLPIPERVYTLRKWRKVCVLDTPVL